MAEDKGIGCTLSVLVEASNKIDDTSKKNIEAMTSDGKYSAELNKDSLIRFNNWINR